jgi:hypothetical protein
MCFSATASFTLGALLISAGTFSVITAYKSNKSYLFFSLIPIFFGIQQGIEGIIWWQLHAGNLSSVHIYAYMYLFFAFYFWPTYVPFCVYRIETYPVRKKIICLFMIVGIILSIIMYTPILFGIIPSNVTIVSHSIHYEVYPWGPLIWTYTTCYAVILIMSLLFSSVRGINIFGIMTLISGLVSYWWHIYAFTSIWCFFAAILSVYIIYLMHRLQADPYLLR